jgi:hypothetical protein
MPKPSSPPPGLSNAPSSISISDATVVPDYFVFDFSGTTVLEDTINGFESGTDKIVGVNFGLGDAFQNLGNGFYITLGDGITNRIRVLSGDTIQETDYLTFSNDPFLLA